MPVQISRRGDHSAGHTLTVGGVVTGRDLKTALLQLVRDGGWTEPALWDFRAVTGIDLGHQDLLDTVRFMQNFMGHLPSRSRVAIVTPTADGRAMAMTYRELQPARVREHIAIFDTMETAGAWLDGRDANAPIEPREPRIELRGAVGALDGQACRVVNVSRSGALLLAPIPAVPGAESVLTLCQHEVVVNMPVRIARNHEASAGENVEEWYVAVRFLTPSDASKQVSMLVTAYQE